MSARGFLARIAAINTATHELASHAVESTVDRKRCCVLRDANSADEALGRQPPRSLEAERGVLGSILLLPDACDEVALILRPEDFYDDANAKIFAHLLAMYEAGGRIDSTLLIERLRTANVLDDVGGVAYLIELSQAVPHAAHAVYYSQIVKDKAILRSLIYTSTQSLISAYVPGASAQETISQAAERISAIAEERSAGDLEAIGFVAQEVLSDVERRAKQGSSVAGLETGFLDLDALTGGLHDSELTILAARPSMGKTALALNIAEYAAVQSRVPTLFVSLEMSSSELGSRLLCSAAGVNGSRLRNGTISAEDRRHLAQAVGELGPAPLFVDSSPTRTMTEIASTARRLKRKKGLGLIVIDYLQLISPDNHRDPRQEQVARIARRLKGLARDLNVPVLCLAQLNRQVEATKERPRLSHLRESGAIEQDADMVMFVHREDYFRADPDEHDGLADLIVSKNRNGQTGIVKLAWVKEFCRFENLASSALQRELIGSTQEAWA